MLGQDVYVAKLGIIGFVRMSQAVAKRVNGFGMDIYYHDRERKKAAERELGAEYLPLDEPLCVSDFVSLHVSLSEDTQPVPYQLEKK